MVQIVNIAVNNNEQPVVECETPTKLKETLHRKIRSVRDITQKIHSSIDKHIKLKRQLLNDSKTNITKLQKISNKAIEQVTGVNPLTEERNLIPIKEKDRKIKIEQDCFEYNTNDYATYTNKSNQQNIKDNRMFYSQERLVKTSHYKKLNNNIIDNNEL